MSCLIFALRQTCIFSNSLPSCWSASQWECEGELTNCNSKQELNCSLSQSFSDHNNFAIIHNGTKGQLIHLYLNVGKFSTYIRHQTCKRGSTAVKETRSDVLKKSKRTSNVTFSSAAWKPIKMHPWVRGTLSPPLHATESCLAIILLQHALSIY